MKSLIYKKDIKYCDHDDVYKFLVLDNDRVVRDVNKLIHSYIIKTRFTIQMTCDWGRVKKEIKKCYSEIKKNKKLLEEEHGCKIILIRTEVSKSCFYESIRGARVFVDACYMKIK